MIAAVLLVMILVGPAGLVRDHTVIRMPDAATCGAAAQTFVAVPFVPRHRDDEQTERRVALCLPVPAAGRDA